MAMAVTHRQSVVRASSLLLLLAALTVQACIRQAEVEVFNATGDPVKLSVPQQEPCSLLPGELCKRWYRPSLTVKSDTHVWSCEIAPLKLTGEEADRFIERRGFSARIIRLRLEEGGMIRVLPVGSSWAGAVETQPRGFPLRPQ